MWNYVEDILGEKNIFASICEMEATCVREHLWLVENLSNERGKKKFIMPLAPYVLIGEHLSTFTARLTTLEVSLRYCGKFSEHMHAKTLSGMTTHDWFVPMQQFLPLCIRSLIK